MKIVAKTFRERDREISIIVVNNKSRKNFFVTRSKRVMRSKKANVLNLKILKTTIFENIFADEFVFDWINDKINDVIE